MEGLEVQGGTVTPPQGAGLLAQPREACLLAEWPMRAVDQAPMFAHLQSAAGYVCNDSIAALWQQIFTLGWNVEGKRLASGSVDQTVRITRVDDHCGVRTG